MKGKYVITLSFSFMLGLNVVIPIFTKQEPFSAPGPTLDPPAYDYWYAPEDSFGMSSMKTVNWTYFRQLFLAHTDWLLEYKRYSYSSWTDGSQYLTIERTWNDSGFWKFNLILDVPVPVYSARFTFGCDRSVLQYVNRSGYEVWLNYTANQTETYSCMFNWSDIASIPGIVITHGMTDGMFWFRFRRDNVPAGHYEFDPTFGTYTTTITYARDIENIICTGYYQMGATGGLADNISIYRSCAAVAKNGKCVIYDSSKNKVGQTDEVLIPANTGLTVFPFSVKPTLTADAWYYLGVCCYNGVAGCMVTYQTSGGSGIKSEAWTYAATFPDSVTLGTTVDADGLFSIYCSYTEGGVSESWQDVASGYFRFSNLSGWEQHVSGYFRFNNVSLFKQAASGYLNFGNASSFRQHVSGYFNFGNDASYNTVASGWFAFNNQSFYTQVDSGYICFSNQAGFEQSVSGYFNLGNTASFKQQESGYFRFDNISSFNQDESGFFNFGNTATNQQVLSGYFNIVNTASYEQLESGYFRFSNTSNSVPVVTAVYPLNNSVGVPLTFTQLQFSAVDGDGDLMDYTAEYFIEACDLLYVPGGLISNGTEAMLINYIVCCPLEYNTQYHWFVNLTDGITWTNRSFVFTTVARAWLQEENGYFLFDNQSGFKQLLSGYFNFKNDSSFKQQTAGWFLFDNISSFKQQESGWFNFNNNSSAVFKDIATGYFRFNNISSDRQIMSGYFLFGNDASFKQIFSGYFNFNNVASFKQFSAGWFVFRNISNWVNRPPVISDPAPVNGSTGIQRFCRTNITVSDLDGNLTTVCFWNNKTGVWVKTQQNNTVLANTTVRDLNASYVTGYNTEYWLKITADDSHVNASAVYHFTTMIDPDAPINFNPSPTNGSTGLALIPPLMITVIEPRGHHVNITFETNVTGVWGVIGTNTNVSNGTYGHTNLSMSLEGTTYYWRVITNDVVGHWTNNTFHFTTLARSYWGFGGGGWYIPPDNTTGDADIVPKHWYELWYESPLAMLLTAIGLTVPSIWIIILLVKRRRRSKK